MTDVETTVTSEPVRDESEDEDTSEAQAQVIGSLRAQVTDLFSQVTQLNGKLVASYDRVSDLEDQLHDASSSLRNASVAISSLELERSHHLAALNTGLLVEKAHVTAELNRLMERATEEAAQRGQAESARRDIEKDLDDLSASLFDQANTMVAEARLNQARSERKVYDAEQALKIAEDAVKEMQVQMQGLQAEKEVAERDAREARVVVGKGKWVERDEVRVGEVPRIRFMTVHTPYAEFITFVVHLRGLRVSQPTPPVISTLLNQPFIARLVNEDSESTVRLDLAPSLNWLSRRSVLAAIHTGMLTVEPVPFSSLVQELHQHPQSTSASSLSCALCGTLVARLPSAPPVSRDRSTNGGSWFKYPLALGSTQNHNVGRPKSAECEPPGQVYIFRLAAPTTSAPPPALAPTHTPSASMPAVGTSSSTSSPRLPLTALSSSRVVQAQTQNSPYPLCTSNYCLTRLRTTCSLWAFVRVGIVERIWEEEVVQPLKSVVNGENARGTPSPQPTPGAGGQLTSNTTVSEKPPVPPRRRRLWEMASALGERAVSWGKESGENSKEKDKVTVRRVPPPPPFHPSAPHSDAESAPSRAEPPPLPRRNIDRGTAATETAASPSHTVAPEIKETTANNMNGRAELDNGVSGATTPVDDTTFTTPPSEVSPLPTTTSHPIATDEPRPSEPPPNPDQEDQLPPPPSSSSPHTVPLPISPTSPAPPTARQTSPAPRPRSRLSTPASPPSSRPTSPALPPAPTRSRAGSRSPAPGGVTARTTSPPLGGTAGRVGKTLSSSSMTTSPLVSGSRPGSPLSGAGAPPLPRRAAARRAVPPPPPPVLPPRSEEGSGLREEVEVGVTESSSSPVAIAGDPVFSEVDTPKVGASASEGGVVGEARGGGGDGEGDGDGDGIGDEASRVVVKRESGSAVPDAATEGVLETADGTAMASDAVIHAAVERESRPADAAVLESARGVAAAVGDVDSAANGIVVSEGGTSVDTTSTKRSSMVTSPGTEGEGFASDATWEERTWKELARLKEDMFWARVGGIRALRG